MLYPPNQFSQQPMRRMLTFSILRRKCGRKSGANLSAAPKWNHGFRLCRRAGSRLYPISQTPVNCYMELTVRLGSAGTGGLDLEVSIFRGCVGIIESRFKFKPQLRHCKLFCWAGAGVSSRLTNAHLKSSSQSCPGWWGRLALVYVLSVPENLLQARYIWKWSLQESLGT